MSFSLSRRALASHALAGLAAAAALAPAGLRRASASASLPRPNGKVVLNVSGRIAVTNDGPAATFDMPMLEALPQHAFTTTTPWYVGPQTFEGVLMSELMQTLGASGSSVLAIALNDYSSEIPTDDFSRYGVILALKRGGQYMPVRDKGPLFIVYPFDTRSELKSEKFFSRSAWQVARLVVS